MQSTIGYLVTIALIVMFSFLGVALTFRPRMIRGLLVKFVKRRWMADEFIMPGALISLRVIGLACLALAVVIIVQGGRAG